MKTFYLIGGTMGVGKTTVCQILKKKLDRAVFLDGDWCWDADPFQVNPETKAMVLDNICYVLNNFLRCSAYQNILFCWVLHEPEIWDAILSRLDRRGCQVKKVALVCRPEDLRRRLEQDIQAGIRQADVLERSLSRLVCYERLPVQRLDVSDQSAEETAERILLVEDDEHETGNPKIDAGGPLCDAETPTVSQLRSQPRRHVFSPGGEHSF